MTAPTNPSELFSPFLPTTYNIPADKDTIDNFLEDTFARISDVTNDKTIGTFVQSSQNFSGEKWFYLDPKVTRNGYQAIYHFPSLPGPLSLPVPNQITIDLNSDPPFPITDIQPEFVVTHTWGSASLPNSAVGAGDGDYFSFMAQGDSRISFTLSDTTLTITTTVDLSAYSGFIVIQYLRRGLS
jgi:hypothetical protein